MIQENCECAGEQISSTYEKIEFDFKVFPNPTDGLLNLSNADFESIQIFDAFGNSRAINFTNRNQIDLKSFPIGVYFLKIESKGKTILKKVVKNK